MELEPIQDELNEMESVFVFDVARDDIVVTLEGETIATVTPTDEGRQALVAFVDGLAPTIAAQLVLTVDSVMEVTLDDEPVLAVHLEEVDEFDERDYLGLDD